MPELTPRKKWFAFLKGEDVGPMVSPLCDDWSLDIPYYWPGDEPEPFPAGHRRHALGQQMAMAEICGWDPTFLCAIDMTPLRQEALPDSRSEEIEGGTRHRITYQTPYGELSALTEHKKTSHTLKAWLETREDYQRMTWLTQAQMDYDEDEAIEQGQALRRTIGERGPMGTWFGPPLGNHLNRDKMWYHIADWPEAFDELREATRVLQLKQIETLRKAGFDYLFYCVDGTEWISPDFFRHYILPPTRAIFERWRAAGGFVLWHSCGHLRRLIEEGFYNALRPEIFETCSEPPVGDLPSLAWAREHLDRRIATKGNVPLNILLERSPEEVRDAVRRVREQTAGYRHVVGLSDDMLKGTPLANAHAFVSAAREK